MSRDEYDERDEDPQQALRVAEVEDREVMAILHMIADRLRDDEPPDVTDYIRVTLAESSPALTYMDDSTAIRIGRWMARAMAQAADDLDGQRVASLEGR